MLFLSATETLAEEQTIPDCQPIFGGGPVCFQSDILSINKKILNPSLTIAKERSFSDNDFIENVSPNGIRYPANTATAFRLYLTNKTKRTLKNITVKDVFPPRFLTFVSSDGSYDTATRTLTITIDELKAKETKQMTIHVLTARLDELPKDNAPLCTINIAMATVNNKTSQDASQICMSRQDQPTNTQTVNATQPSLPSITPPTIPPTTKGGLPVVSPVTPQPGQKTPSTGANMLALIGLLPVGGAGLLLRKKTF